MRQTRLATAAALVVVAIGLAWWRRWPHPARVAPPLEGPLPGAASAPDRRPGDDPFTGRRRAPVPEAVAGNLSAAEKAGRVERIKRDYDEIRAKASAEYSAAGANFPGGLNAFLRQLALLEREKRADLAAVLSPRELEDLELRETNAGKLVQQRLGTINLPDEQRRAVFRLQRDFDDRFALTFDTSPGSLLEREKARQVLETAIGEVLVHNSGDAFAAWDEDFGRARTFAAQQGLPPDAAWRLWDLKNEFTVKRLELVTERGSTPQQLALAQNNLIRDTEQRAMNILGPGAMQAGRNEVLGWLPRVK